MLVETKLESPLPDTVKFINEKGAAITQSVEYDWKPIHCNTCKGFGNGAKDCKKGAVSKSVKRWIPKTQQSQPELKQTPIQQPADEGFVAVKKKASTPQKYDASDNDKNTSMSNKFDVLIGKNNVEETDNEGTDQIEECAMQCMLMAGMSPLRGMDNILIWNVRGLNDLDKRRKVKDFISQ